MILRMENWECRQSNNRSERPGSTRYSPRGGHGREAKRLIQRGSLHANGTLFEIGLTADRVEGPKRDEV